MSARTLPDPATEPFMSARRVAAIMDLSDDAVYDAVARGDWPAIHVGRSVRIPTARWLSAVGLANDEGPGTTPGLANDSTAGATTDDDGTKRRPR